LGNVSYGVYLWHWPVFVVMTPERVHVGPLVLTVLRFAVTAVIALVSYRFLETPIRKNGLPGGRPALVVPLAFVASILPIFLAKTLRKAPPPRPLEVVTAGAYPTKYSVTMQTLPAAKDLRPGQLRVLTLGDSVASFLGIAMRHGQDDREVFVAERGVGSCTLFEAEVRVVDGKRIEGTSCSRDWVKDTEALRPDVTLIVMGGAFLTPKTCEPTFAEAYKKRLGVLVDGMGERAGRVVVAKVPYPVGRWRYGDVPERVVCLNTILDDFARSRAPADHRPHDVRLPDEGVQPAQQGRAHSPRRAPLRRRRRRGDGGLHVARDPANRGLFGPPRRKSLGGVKPWRPRARSRPG
jgi:hypothetical protein